MCLSCSQVLWVHISEWDPDHSQEDAANNLYAGNSHALPLRRKEQILTTVASGGWGAPPPRPPRMSSNQILELVPLGIGRGRYNNAPKTHFWHPLPGMLLLWCHYLSSHRASNTHTPHSHWLCGGDGGIFLPARGDCAPFSPRKNPWRKSGIPTPFWAQKGQSPRHTWWEQCFVHLHSTPQRAGDQKVAQTKQKKPGNPFSH